MLLRFCFNILPLSVCFFTLGSERKMQSALKSSDVHEFGTVSKKSLRHFKCGKHTEVYRLRDSFPRDFSKNVKEAVDKFVKYHVLKFNCLHFALCVLEVSKIDIFKGIKNLNRVFFYLIIYLYNIILVFLLSVLQVLDWQDERLVFDCLTIKIHQ